jgi:transcriptional regulator with XRE-family HTH domain
MLNPPSPESESSSETIQRFLAGYDLGRKLRQLRLRKKIGLADLSKHTGLSPSMLSQLENGKMIPTLPTLSRIAMVFDVGLDHFFDGKSRSLISIVRANERIRFPASQDAAAPMYFFECLAFATQSKGMQAYLADFPVYELAEIEEHSHEGSEFLFVIEGQLKVRFQGHDHELSVGDSLYMESIEPHGYRALNGQPARAIVVALPPRGV